MIRTEIDAKELREIGAELGATEQQIRAAYNRALNRAAGTIRRITSQGLRSELGLRNAAAIRRRLRDKRVKGNGGLAGRVLWFGTNDMAFGAFKGKPIEGQGGVTFRGRTIRGAFIARGKVFKRSTAASLPIAEQTIPVEEEMNRFIEAEILPAVGDIVMENFIRDLRARTSLGVGR
jgi:hypothetical protein